MKKETAQQISLLMLEFSAKLNESVELVAAEGDANDTKYYKTIVGKLMGEMLIEIMNPIYKEHPDLKPPQLR
jgi:hypothetical protein